MDGYNDIKITILTDIKQALADVTTLKEKLDSIGNIKGSGIQNQAKYTAAAMDTFVNSYSKTIGDMTRTAEDAFIRFKNTGDMGAFKQYQELLPTIRQLNTEQAAFNKTLAGSQSIFGKLGETLKSNLGWIATSIGIGSAVGAITDIAKLETEFNQLKTVMPELEENQATYNQAIKDSFALAEKYGTKIKDVTDSLRLMGRGYHELAASEKLAEIALKLSVADNFNPETSTKAIEAVVGAYGKQSEAVAFATHVMDSMTKVSHTSQVSAQDMAEALLRSAAAAKTVGISYDELAAMIAVISRNTGLSGQTIGDGIKSIANSIHSSKAIESLKEMGVEVYKIGNDGQKEFRKITDVLLDVSIKAKSTNQNFEELFRNLSGGKFQVTKLSSLLGDPNEYLRVLGNSINSNGFTDKQLAIQMDTIQRKAQTLKASFEELLVTGGNESGFRNSLKSILETLNQILKGLNNINPVVWETVGSITKFSLAFVALRTAVNFASSSYALLRTTIVSTTAAQEALNVATTVNPWGALAKLVVLAGTALATYSYYAGQAVTAQEQANQAADNAITAKSSEIEMTKQQVSYMETLGNTYVSLQDALKQVGDNEEKAAEIKKTMGTVTEQLTQIVGKEAADRILASEDIKGAITQEQAVHNEKTAKMQQELDALRATQVKLANDTISMCNERIGAINAEAEAFDKACDSIGQALGKIDEIMFKHLRNKANYLNNLANGDIRNEWKIAGIPVPEDQDISGVTQQISNEAAEATRQADEIKENALNYWAEKGRVALGKVYTPGSYNTTSITTGDIPEDTGTPKAKRGHSGGNGSAYAPADHTEEAYRLDVGHEVNKMMAEAKIAADAYDVALTHLNAKQEMFGATSELSTQKIMLMNGRVKELIGTALEYQSQANEYEQQANDRIASNEKLQEVLKSNKVAWSELTKEEKHEFVEQNKQYIEDEKTLVKLLNLADKLRVAAADAGKQANSIGTETARVALKTPEQLYQKDMQNLNLDQQHEIYGLGYKATDAQKQAIELKYALEELERAQKRLNEVEGQYGKGSDEYKKQQVEVDKLKNNVNQLGNSLKDKVSEGLEGITSKLLLHGENWRKVWDELWMGLAEDALKALFKIQNNSPSLLSQILGLFGGGGSSAGTTTTATTGVISDFPMVAHSGENITSVAPKMHDGGLVNTNQLKDDEVLRTLQVGERVLSKDQNEFFTSMVSRFNNPEAFKGVQVEPYLKNPELAKAATVNVQVQQQNNHIKELQTANELMRQQNQMIMQMVQNGGNGNVTVVTTQVSADQVLQVLQQNPSALNDILGRNRSIGYR